MLLSSVFSLAVFGSVQNNYVDAVSIKPNSSTVASSSDGGARAPRSSAGRSSGSSGASGGGGGARALWTRAFAGVSASRHGPSAEERFLEVRRSRASDEDFILKIDFLEVLLTGPVGDK